MSISSKWSTLIRYITSQDYRDYRFVRQLHIFDSGYYLALLNESSGSTTEAEGIEDPLWLYFQNSRKELKRISVSDENWQQFNDPHPLFDTCYYMSRYAKQVGTRNPFAHYLIEGWKQGLHPSPLFDAEFYSLHSGWNSSEGDPLTHFSHHGLKEKCAPSVLFDMEWYYYQTSGSELAQKNPLKHYKQIGILEGKRPHPLFNPDHYLANNGVPGSAKKDPYLHYLLVGERKGWSPIKYFHPSYYRNRYMGGGDHTTAFEHYIKFGSAERHETNSNIEKLPYKPLISVIVPVFDPDHRYLNICIRSVVHQSYPYWQLCLVDDCSSRESTRDLIKKWAAFDERIIYTFRSDNGGISAATQTGYDISSGEYIGFLDNDDKLSKVCLFQVARNISKSGGEIFYSDEDLIDGDGGRCAIFRKPGYNKALLYSHNYITHFCVVSRELYQRIGGLRSEFDGAQDYDLMLRLGEEAGTMVHIPKILYHWRALATSTSISHDQKPYAHDAGKRALQQSIDRSRLDGQVEGRDLNYHYRIEFNLPEEPSVAVFFQIEGGRQSIEWLREKTDYHNCDFYSPAMTRKETAVSSASGKTSFLNELINESESEYIALLGNGADRITQNWLSELISKFRLDEGIGITCGRVHYDGSDGPSYTIANLDDKSVSYYAAFLDAVARHASGLQNLQFINGCNWHICVIKRSLWNVLEGFDIDRFPHHLGMLDFCYRATAQGSKILYTPDAMIDQWSSSQAPQDDDRLSAHERKLFQKRHRDQLRQIERWYNSEHMVDIGESRQEFYRWLVGNSV